MEPPHLVGIHLGTSEVRVAVYDVDGGLRASGEADIGGQTTAAWERAFREATPPLPTNCICSVAGTSGTAVLVDEYGEPVFRPQMYYEAAQEYARRIRGLDVANELADRDIALSPTSAVPKLLKLREEHPRRFEDVEWILNPSTWLLYRLRYGHATRWHNVETDWTNALKFGADIEPALPKWYDPLYEVLDIPRHLLPAIRPPGTFIGVAESELAARTGFVNAKLYQGLTDGNASVLANGCLEPGDFSITCGAASVIKYVSESITAHDALYYHRHPIKGYLPGAAFDTGVVMQWFCDRLLNCSQERGLELAQRTAPGDEYEVYLQGNRSPFFDPGIGNSLLGITPDTDLSASEVNGRIARGIATGVALAEHMYIRIVEELFDTDIDQVRLMGDGSPAGEDPFEWWYELRSSIWRRPVVEMEPRTTAGLMIPPALITSVYEDADEASERLLRYRRTVDPDPAIGDHYDDRKRSYFERWRSVADLYRGEPTA